MPIFNPDKLRRIGREVFERIGATPEEARIVADLLVSSNLAGHDSHGVVRIPQYVSGVQSGQIQLGTTVEIERGNRCNSRRKRTLGLWARNRNRSHAHRHPESPQKCCRHRNSTPVQPHRATGWISRTRRG